MTDKEAWVRFAAGAANHCPEDGDDSDWSAQCAGFADAMLAEMKERDLEDGPLVVALDADTEGIPTINIQIDADHTASDGSLRIFGTVDTSS